MKSNTSNCRYKKLIYHTDISSLKKISEGANLKRSRICLHDVNADKIQQMIINISYDSYIQPHRQKRCKKSYMIIEGGLCVYFFDDMGKVSETKILDIQKNENPLMIMFDAERWHTVKSISVFTTYLESRNSYTDNDTEFASWAPKSADSKNGLLFLQNLI